MDITATNSHAITPLVTAGETLIGTVTGKPLSENAIKITSGVTSLLDGLFPTLAGWANFDLNGVLEGATEALNGVNTAVLAAKTKQTAIASATVSSAA